MPIPAYERRHSDGEVGSLSNRENGHQDLVDINTAAGDTALSNGGNSDTNSHAEIVDIMQDPNIDSERNLDFDTQVHTPEVFMFDYGVVVIWGMTLHQEERFLKEVSKFESEKLDEDDLVDPECFNFYYTREYQARIYNDFITLRDKSDYMGKLAISHAIAQSVKVCGTFFPDVYT